MTTPADLWVRIAEIRDRQALEVVAQLVKTELVVLQTQVTQLEQLNQAVAERLQKMERTG
jgi:hypothetical protein